MKAFAACLLGMLLITGALAQNGTTCDPATAGTALVDLSDPIGQLACKVPKSVNLTSVLQKLTGTLKVVTAAQLKQLPDLVKLTVSVKPQALLPLLSLSGDQLERLVPLLTKVPVDTLKQVFPLLASQPQSTVDKIVRFLQQIPRDQLERLSPLFASLTPNEVNVLVHALQVLPEHAVYKLADILRALGPVTDSVVTVHQAKGILPRYSSSNSSSSSSSSSGSGSSTGSSTKSTEGSGKTGPFKGFIFGRKLKQTDQERADAALAAADANNGSSSAPAPAPATNGCDPSAVGVDIGINLLNDFGVVVCKFGPDALKGPLNDTINILLGANQETLAALPEITDALSKLDAKAFTAFFKIPQSTLQGLLPVLEGLDPKAVKAQLTRFGNLDAATIDKLILFLNATPPSQIKVLLPLFSRLNDKQVDSLIYLSKNLSPGQIQLGIHLLTVFGPALEVIGSKIPQEDSRGNSFMIGPVRVMLNGASSTSSESGFGHRFKLPFFGGH